MNYWLIVGATENWHVAFKCGNIWGLKETQLHLWESLNENDKVLFYATKPVGGIIGYGVVRTKMRQYSKALWPEEVRRNKVIWPLRLEFDVESCLPPDEWHSKRLISKEIWPRAGFQPLSEAIAEELISRFEGRKLVLPKEKGLWVAEEPAGYEVALGSGGKAIPAHEDLQDKLIEIGRLQKYIAEKEYPFDIGRLDVVWRRVLNSVPTYVFEVQVGGDVYHALAKLKHAFDLWNSHIFIVASRKDHSKASNLLSGTFHEIGTRIKFIELETVRELHKRKKAYFDLERALGI